MPPRWGEIMPTISQVPVPTGWPTIKIAYSGITTKLSERQCTVGGKTVTVTLAMQLQGIGYWRQRLTQDEGLVNAGQPPATTGAIPEPMGWPSIKTAYAGITTKLSERQCTVNGKLVNVTLAMRLSGIAYWRNRLTEDETLVRAGQPPAAAPP